MFELKELFQNPNPDCKGECRFQYGFSSTTCAYYTPTYDKHGKNLNPDGNITSSEVTCTACDKKWVSRTQYGKTQFTEIFE